MRIRKFKVKSWVLVVMLVPLLFIDATLLRWNHIRMAELRDAVLAIDAGISDDTDSEEMQNVDSKLALALTKLKEFTFSHIVVNVVEENGVQRVTFGTGPFYLEHQYIRAAHLALESAEQKFSGDGNPNGNIYAMASGVCQPQAIANGWAWNSSGYIACMMDEIQKYPAAAEINDTIVANLPSTELYRHNYASPVWAPDFAGIMILVTLGVILVLVWRLVYYVVIRIALLFV